MTDIDDVNADIAERIAWDVQEALRKERIEIACMIEAEASEHEDAARDLRDDDDPDNEAWMHDADARTLNRLADKIRSRTPAEPDPELTDEIAF